MLRVIHYTQTALKTGQQLIFEILPKDLLSPKILRIFINTAEYIILNKILSQSYTDMSPGHFPKEISLLLLLWEI